jgi:hypothetical protein
LRGKSGERGWGSRDVWIIGDEPPQWPVGGLGDADPRSQDNLLARHRRSFAHQNRRPVQRKRVVSHIDSQRRTDLSGPIRQIDIAARSVSSGTHEIETVNGLYRTYENGARETGFTRDRVEAPMHSIYEVDVRRPWRAVQRFGSSRSSGRCVTREVMFAEVCLGFHDASGGYPFRGVTLQDAAEEITRDELRVSREELARQRSGGVCPG